MAKPKKTPVDPDEENADKQLSVENQALIGQAIIAELLGSRRGRTLGVLSGGLDYDQDSGDYRQRGGGEHNQNSGSYDQAP